MGSWCSKCCGGDSLSEDENEQIAIKPPVNVSQEERRQAALEAAERRKAEEENRGHKNDPDFQRLKIRQEKIDKAEEAARKAGSGGAGPLTWQVN